MTKWVLGFGLAAALAVPSQAQAFDWCGAFQIGPPPPPPCVSYVQQVVPCYRPVWREEKFKYEVQRWSSKEIVEKVKVKQWVSRWEEVMENRTFYTPVERIEERDVVSCRWVAACVIDPWTGCPYMTWYPRHVVERVKVAVHDYKSEERKVPVKVLRWSQEDRVVEQRRLEWTSRPEMVEGVRYRCDWVLEERVMWRPVYWPYCP